MSPMSGPPPAVAAERQGSVTSLLTDHYELTMLDAAIRSGAAQRRAAFEVFARRLPAGRRFGVVAGTGRLLDALTAFTFGEDELRWLSDAGFLAPATLEWLADYRFRGAVSGYREGELFFPGSPVLTVEGTFAEAVILETLVLSILNHDSAIAAAGSRMVLAAGGRPLIEAGGRRTHEWAAPAAARAAYLVGFTSTSNLEAGRRWGVPTGGTTAHSFVLAHHDERAAFEAQVASTGPATTLLVDTYDIEVGIRTAVEVAGPRLGAVRIDSGDLALEARRARALLDSLGASGTQIVVSGDLDERSIAALADAPVDRMLVGTELVTGSGAPTAELVYKLVAIAAGPGTDARLQPVAKRSAGKATRGGTKAAGRRIGADGCAVGEVVVSTHRRSVLTDRSIRPLQVAYLVDGAPVELNGASGSNSTGGASDPVDARGRLDAARAHHARVRDELPPSARELGHGEAAFVASLLGVQP